MTVTVRAATAAEADQIVALQVARNGADCDGPVRDLLSRPGVGPSRFTVAMDGDRVVSSMCLMPADFRVGSVVVPGGSVVVPGGEIEYVATWEDYEYRGLVRAQMDLAHQWSAEDGHLLTVIGGIPFFYRQFGYEYAVPFPRLRQLYPPHQISVPEGWSVRPAAVEDLDVVRVLQERAGRRADLVRVRPGRPWWEWWVRSARVAVSPGGAVEGVAGFADAPALGPEFTVLSDPAFTCYDALAALIGAAPSQTAMVIHSRPDVVDMIGGITTVHPRDYSLYVRVPDPVALLDHLRPVLTARLQASAWMSHTRPLLISSYSRALVLQIEGGEVTAVETAPREQNPRDKGGIGIPPDQMATFILGRYGAIGLDARCDDVSLGKWGGLAETLFPRLTPDLCLG